MREPSLGKRAAPHEPVYVQPVAGARDLAYACPWRSAHGPHQVDPRLDVVAILIDEADSRAAEDGIGRRFPGIHAHAHETPRSEAVMRPPHEAVAPCALQG